ncbi:hypothetical protein NA57DRAFT_60604 [Rhizodiscina lignyota]|uniref:DUF3824 domain-containing protein n=1 Tax=Rhizodiscina lignyota TaxID=1504668 RepID=A0A9P4I8D8_9PEZI|nr:hypothetical protein NA57DRAFT_60604 [Rhizodiscina lignyota]
MSDYGYDDAPRRRRSTRVRDRDPEYVTETTYIQRGPGQPSRDLVFRGRDDDVEDIERDFPPPGSRRSTYRDDYAPPRRARSVGGRRYDDYDDYDEYAPAAAGAAGAAAGYAAGRARRGSRYDDGYHSDDYERPPRRERRKSKVTEVLEDLGLGGVAGAITGRSRSRGRGDHYDSDSDRSTRSRPRDKSQNNRKKWQQAATAALIAGATEAYRARKDPNKGTRIATAALASAGLDSFLDREPGHHSKRHVLESVVGGLAANRLANGPRDRSQSRGRSASRSPSRGGLRSRSRSLFRSLSRGGRRDDSGDRGGSRSRSRGRGLKDIAALGGVAAVGKAIYDRVRSKSRGRNRSRSESEDSYVPSRRQQYKGADRGGPDDDTERGRSQAASYPEVERKRGESSSSVSTTDLENQRKKSRGKELLTAGFATVATIHAAHGVYSSMKASDERHKAVAKGEMTKEQARKQKSKNMLQDAAAVGIAALGIKGAFSEWKEMNEQRHEVKELEEKRRKKRKRRENQRKDQRQNQYPQGPGMYANPYGPYPAPMPVYGDANPYNVGNLPPPPMGAPQY